MIITFKQAGVSAAIEAPDSLLPFFLWLAANRSDPSVEAVLILISAYDAAKDNEEKENISRTITEILITREPATKEKAL